SASRTSHETVPGFPQSLAVHIIHCYRSKCRSVFFDRFFASVWLAYPARLHSRLSDPVVQSKFSVRSFCRNHSVPGNRKSLLSEYRMRHFLMPVCQQMIFEYFGRKLCSCVPLPFVDSLSI